MRQIKFRAWHTKQEQLADVAVIDFNDFGGNGTITTEYGDEWGLEWCVLEQFTGLHDKNGKEIYEGDIYETEYMGTGVIVWDNDYSQFWVWVESNSEDERDLFIKHPEHGVWGEVIGNIHDNPELL